MCVRVCARAPNLHLNQSARVTPSEKKKDRGKKGDHGIFAEGLLLLGEDREGVDALFIHGLVLGSAWERVNVGFHVHLRGPELSATHLPAGASKPGGDSRGERKQRRKRGNISSKSTAHTEWRVWPVRGR